MRAKSRSASNSGKFSLSDEYAELHRRSMFSCCSPEEKALYLVGRPREKDCFPVPDVGTEGERFCPEWAVVRPAYGKLRLGYKPTHVMMCQMRDGAAWLRSAKRSTGNRVNGGLIRKSVVERDMSNKTICGEQRVDEFVEELAGRTLLFTSAQKTRLMRVVCSKMGMLYTVAGTT